MPKQTAKHHKKAARHERAARHVKRVRAGRPTRAKKPVTPEEQVAGLAAEEGLRAYAEPATVEVMEIEVVSSPEDSLEFEEAEPLLVHEGWLP